MDPTPEQWQGILKVVRERRLLPFLDSAYQVPTHVHQHLGMALAVCQYFISSHRCVLTLRPAAVHAVPNGPAHAPIRICTYKVQPSCLLTEYLR